MANRVMPKWLVCTATLALSSGTALAGDFANLNVLGFSSDGNIFAFEQYGVQDGSGFPYADRFYIDTNTCLLYTSPSPRDKRQSRMPSSA